MRISRNWLNDYLELADLEAAKIEALLTTRVAEVDSVEETAVALEQAIICRVLKVESPVELKNLKLLTVDLGAAGKTKVVCGAPNCREGLLSAYLPLGAKYYLPPHFDTLRKVEGRSFGKIYSEGILVSEGELGIGNDHTGIIDLSDEGELKLGSKLADLVGPPDVIFVIDNKAVTHRPDLWGHFGFARELAAILGRPLKISADDWADDSDEGKLFLSRIARGKSRFKIVIEANSKARRFVAMELKNVSTKRSPLWIRRRLHSMISTCRNLLVDLSNYVMFDVGQPNHIYDAKLLQGDTVYVRLAHEGERFVGLDGVERKLSAEDVAIADSKVVLALGGVIGGAECSVQDNSTHLLLESANFDPIMIRQTAKRQQVRTDASNRFEKDQSPYAAPLGLVRYVNLLQACDPKAQLASGIIDIFPQPPLPLLIETSYDFIRRRLGSSLPDAEICRILKGLHFAVQEQGAKILVTVPYFRATRDVTIAEDLVEEVGRVYGYENIAENAPKIETRSPELDSRRQLENEIRDFLSANGFAESYNYSFQSADFAKKLGYGTETAVELQNPIDQGERFLRTSLLPGIIETAQRNSRFVPDLALFEIARAYFSLSSSASKRSASEARKEPVRERRLLCLAQRLSEKEEELAAELRPAMQKGAHFYALLSLLKRLLERFSVQTLELRGLAETGKGSEYVSRSWMHPYRQASLLLAGQELGLIAELRPGLIADLDGRLIAAELDIEKILSLRDSARRYRQISRFPSSLFEMSVVMPQRDPCAKLFDLLRQGEEAKYLQQIEVIAVYEGPPLEKGEKSISVKLLLGAEDRTLSALELSAIQSGFMQRINSSAYALR